MRIKIRCSIFLGALLLLVGCGTAAPAQAAARQLSLTLSSQGNSSFDGLVQQAEQEARNLIQQIFAQDPSLTEISLQVLGEHNGSEAPLLLITVARADWQPTASLRSQTIYFGRSSAVLLGMMPPQGVQTAALPIAPPDLVSASLSDIEPNFYDQ